jgi:hypothetical protein
MRVQVLKRTIVATDPADVDGFRVGAFLDLSASVAVLMTAARWVRRVYTRGLPRRSAFSLAGRFPDRRLLADRRVVVAASL